MPGLSSGIYRPHLVVQPPDVRTPAMMGNELLEDYLGVCFVEGPETAVAGQPTTCKMELIYYDGVDYQALQPGATFTIREGGMIVGFGSVLERQEGDISTYFSGSK